MGHVRVVVVQPRPVGSCESKKDLVLECSYSSDGKSRVLFLCELFLTRTRSPSDTDSVRCAFSTGGCCIVLQARIIPSYARLARYKCVTILFLAMARASLPSSVHPYRLFRSSRFSAVPWAKQWNRGSPRSRRTLSFKKHTAVHPV